MCGIAGLFRPSGIAPADVNTVERMTGAQAHRGPDGHGLERLDRVVFGHRRLAIIDLSPAGKQPMANEDGTVWVTYNGELYNHRELRCELLSSGHRFRSNSDTEVIVHGYEQWGLQGLLTRLRGMFAFGLYDPDIGLLLARDQLGIKPLYVHVDGDGTVLFASEVRSLLASGAIRKEMDVDAVAGFLLAGSVAAPRTYVRGIKSLLAAQYMQCRSDRTIECRTYWSLPLPRNYPDGPGRVDDVRAPTAKLVGGLLNDSVERHLVSDVQVGVFLSGGVDSGAVATLAARARNRAGAPPLATLTVAFDEREFDESDQTRLVSRALGADHREVRVTRDAFLAELPAFFAAMDQPSNDGVNTYFVSKAAREAGLTVVLSGLGGDEVFWGYGHYGRLARWRQWLVACPPAIRRLAARTGGLWGGARGRDNWMRFEFLRAGCHDRELYLLLRGFFPPRQVMDLLGIGQSDLDRAVDRQFEGLADDFNHIEFARYLHDQLLRDTDVFSMAHSIEVRVPLLDLRLVEYAASLQPSLKLATAAVNKPLLVDAVGDPLVARAGAQSKKGFSFPMDRWMRQAAGQLEELATAGTLLDPDAVRARWADFRERRQHWSRAWALSTLGAVGQC